VTDAAADVECHASYADKSGASPPYLMSGNRTNTPSITTATTTTIVPSPGSGVERSLRHLSLFNNHGSTSVTVTIEHTDGTTAATLRKCILAPNEVLVFDGVGVWTHYAADGSPFLAVGPIATQAQMEAGTVTNKAVAPGLLHFHPGFAKAWGAARGDGTLMGLSYNVSSIGDTNTGRLQVNVATDFSSADYAIISNVERGTTSLSVGNVEQTGIRNASPAAGGFEIESYDHTATNNAADDPQTYFWSCWGDQA
jgi:hypothetical protein